MLDLKIKSVDDHTIAVLDQIVSQKGYADRSELIRDILKKYAQFGDNFYTHELPDTVKILLKDSLSDYPEKFAKLLQYTLELTSENTRLLRKMEQLFFDENEKS